MKPDRNGRRICLPGRIIALLLVGCLFPWISLAAEVNLATTTSLTDLSRYAEMLEDPAGSHSLAEVMRLDRTAWTGTPERMLQLGYSTAVWWVRIELDNRSDAVATRILEVGWPLLNYLDVSVFDNGQPVATVLTGDQRPFANRPLPTRTFAIPLSVDPGHRQTVLLRLAMHSGIFYAVPLRLWLTADFHAQTGQDNLIQGAYLGSILALFLYNLLLFLSTRDHNLLLYSFYLGGFTLWNIGFSGMGLEYVWRDVGWFNLQFNLLLPAYIHGLASLFVVRYLETRERAPVLHRTIMIATGLTLAIMPFTWANQVGLKFSIIWVCYFFSVMSGLLITLYLVAGIWLMYLHFRPARYFVMAWSCLFLGIFVYRSTQFAGLGVPDHPLVENSINLGSALEFLLLALALGDRFNLLRNEKLAAEQEAYRLQVSYSNDLTDQVNYRTCELQTTLNQLHQALQAERLAQEEQKQFLITVSHELRTPLSVIDIVAQNLEIDEARTSETERRARYDKILQATHRMASLLDNYLNENRFSLLRQGPQCRPTDMAQLLTDAATAARVLADGHQLVVLAETLPTDFPCDPDLTRLALRNLADNAVKYTPAGTTVRLSGEHTHDGLVLTVEDEGDGLPEVIVERLFQPGQRGRDTRDKPGWGMGLPLARHMIESQGGTLTATSTPGRGCLFRIWLPDNGPRGVSDEG